jgi:hypothetical protein
VHSATLAADLGNMAFDAYTDDVDIHDTRIAIASPLSTTGQVGQVWLFGGTPGNWVPFKQVTAPADRPNPAVGYNLALSSTALVSGDLRLGGYDVWLADSG